MSDLIKMRFVNSDAKPKEMTKIDIEQIKADREAGTKGPWSVESDGHYPVIRKNFREDHHMDVCGPVHGYMYSRDEDGEQRANARRIARVPDMEDALIEAKTAFDAIVQRSHDDPLGTSKVIDMREIAEEFLERFK